jgi:RimJ/RimL family protein N-acetyltransferase
MQREVPWPATVFTARLVLRPIEPADVPVISRLWTDPVVRRYLGGPVAADEVARRDELCVGVPDLFSVVRSSDEAVLGLVVIEPVSDHSEPSACGNTEVSYQFLPEYWGHGYGREAVSAAIAWALENISPAPPVVIAVTQEANKNSLRLLEAIGMTPVDRFVEWDAPQVMYSVGHTALRRPDGGPWMG